MPMNPEKYEALKALHTLVTAIRISPFFTDAEKRDHLRDVDRDIADVIAPPVDHFLKLADQGKAASRKSAEHAARQLARAVEEYAGALDEKSAKGLIQFITQVRKLETREV